jgi:Tol biopolymer transport system component
MPDIRELLEREVAPLAPPEAWERVQRRAEQRRRRRRLGAAIVAVVVAVLGTAGVWLVANGLRERGPQPGSSGWDDGRIVYECPDPTTPAGQAIRPTLCIMRPDGSDRRTIVPTPSPGEAVPTSMSSPAWSPDGARLAFRASWDAACDRCFDLYVMDADGSNLRRVTVGGLNPIDPAWSPDGSWIAFDTGRGGGIMKVHPDGAGLTRLDPGVGANESDWWPSWSPDGTRIAFTRVDTATFGNDLLVMDADGRGARVAVSGSDVGGGQVYQPAWSPDGRLIAFAARGDGHHVSIWGWDAARALEGDPTNHPWQITASEPGNDMGPVWIDGGAQVAFIHEAGGRIVLEAVRVDRGGVTGAGGASPGPVPEGSPYRTTLATGFTGGYDQIPSAEYSFRPPPGGAAGACPEPGPAELVSCSTALQRAGIEDSGPQGASIDVRLVHGAIHPDGSVDPDDDRPVWAVTYRDVAASAGGATPQPARIDWEVDVDASSGAFLSEGVARTGARTG